MARDYLAAHFKKSQDKVDYGVVGMRWGVRRSRATLRTEAAKRSQAAPVKKPETNPDGSETSASRYSRLAAQAKAGGASSMSDTDLKFFNARTEALSKINKLNERQPGWLQDTAKKVLQQTAQNQMQGLSDALANKYIGGPIKDAVGQHVTKEAKEKAAEVAKEAAKKAASAAKS